MAGDAGVAGPRPGAGGRLDTRRTNLATGQAGLPDRVVLRLPDGYTTDHLLRHITVRLLENTTSDWLAGYGAAQAFHAEHGHLRAPRDRVVNGVNLKNWVNNRRKDYHAGRLSPDEIRALTELGIEWSPSTRPGGRAWPPPRRSTPGKDTCASRPGIGKTASPSTTGSTGAAPSTPPAGCPPDRVQALNQLGVTWTPRQPAWDRGLAAAHAFHARERHLRVPEDHIEAGVNLNQWIGHQRRCRTAGTLPPDRIHALYTLGIDWTPMQAGWDRNLAAAAAFYQREGHLRVPLNHRETGVNLYVWLGRHRRMHRAGTLSPAKFAALDQIGMHW